MKHSEVSFYYVDRIGVSVEDTVLERLTTRGEYFYFSPSVLSIPYFKVSTIA